MNRREAINRVAIILGGSVIGADFFLSGCNSNPNQENNLFTTDDIAFLNEVAETILPETSTPGAKSVNVGSFMALMVQDCYTPEEQQVFVKGVADLQRRSEERFDAKFMELSAGQKNELLTSLDKAQKEALKIQKPGDTVHYFRMMKELTLLGYFTSEAGCTKALRYVPVPGKYIGCIPYKKGEKAWAT
ncbi:gluconate 2-dehydrogenase subunit 3 family protein [Pedobacter immunditicola]|uniref:gluconate 2-dehydrogenase subunit 3 family protein n=1 Tax=Pedobacter immunditicola TaxID=3133440 RepID=UPI0030991F8E